jgi:hypothetical protein
VGGKGGGGGWGEKWTKPCMHIWIIKEKKRKENPTGSLGKLLLEVIIDIYNVREFNITTQNSCIFYMLMMNWIMK